MRINMVVSFNKQLIYSSIRTLAQEGVMQCSFPTYNGGGGG
jgi:hypothetical protein